jgi:hypothetical protein
VVQMMFLSCGSGKVRDLGLDHVIAITSYSSLNDITAIKCQIYVPFLPYNSPCYDCPYFPDPPPSHLFSLSLFSGSAQPSRCSVWGA